MELYRELAVMRCFTREELVKMTGSDSAADWQIRKYMDKGYIERVRRDLYAVSAWRPDSQSQIVTRLLPMWRRTPVFLTIAHLNIMDTPIKCFMKFM